MAYGYKTNKEFIDKSYQLLGKLEDKGLWNKDTLIVGLDKSVRPLAHTLRKLSSLEGNSSPDIKFFNYSSFDAGDTDYVNSFVVDNVKKEMGDRRIKDLGKYKNVLVLDDCAWTGKTFIQTNNVLNKFFEDNGKKPQIYFGALSSEKETFYDAFTGKNKKIIRADNQNLDRRDKWETGVKDVNGKETDYLNVTKPVWKTSEIQLRSKYFNLDQVWESFSDARKQKLIKESAKGNKMDYEMFTQRRNQLSKDIKEYMHDIHPENISEKNKGLEKIISGIFIFSFLLGLFLSSGNLTGNVVGNSLGGQKLLGIVLILVGIGGFFVYRKLK